MQNLYRVYRALDNQLFYSQDIIITQKNYILISQKQSCQYIHNYITLFTAL
jgi:hypothetical protein